MFFENVFIQNGYLHFVSAPTGAIQYFTAPTGRLRSFGYDPNSPSSYTGGLFYAIAFKRTPERTCIRFTINFMNLRNNPTLPTPEDVCMDYLFVPELEVPPPNILGSVSSSKVCEINDASSGISFYCKKLSSYRIFH